MRILFLSHYFSPECNAPASRVFEMCRRWVRLGHDVTVITCVPNVPNGVVYEGYRNHLYQREVIDGVNVVRVWTYLAANRGIVKRITNFLSYVCTSVPAGMLVKRPDVMVATSPQFFCGWAGVLLGWLRRVPFVLEVRDLWPDSIVAVEAMSNKHVLGLLRTMEKYMYARADHIVTVGDGYRRGLLAKGVAPERISVITNGIDRDTLNPRQANAPLARRFGLGKGFVCAHVGTIGAAAGLEVVLRAAEHLKRQGRTDVRFLFVGDGARRQELQDLAQQRGLDNVVFAGRIAKGDIPPLLAGVDACLVHLREAELFRTVLPSKMFEAAAMEKPILLGVEGCAAEFVQAAQAGLCFQPGNERALAAAVTRLADDRPLARRLGASGRRHVLAHFDLDELALRYLGILTRLAAMRHGGRGVLPHALLQSPSHVPGPRRTRWRQSSSSYSSVGRSGSLR